MGKIIIEEKIKKIEKTQTVILITLSIILFMIVFIATYIINDISDKNAETEIVKTHQASMSNVKFDDYSILSSGKIPVSSQSEAEKRGYNIRADKWIDSVINVRPEFSFSSSDDLYHVFRWEDVRIRILFSDYTLNGNPTIFCELKSGQHLMFQTYTDIPHRRIGLGTTNKLINLCKLR